MYPPQFPKEIGIVPVRTLMGILLDLVTKLKDLQENTNSVPMAEKPQEGSELFLEINQSSTEEAKKEQVGEKFSYNFISLFHADSKMTFSVFRSFFPYLAPSSSIHVWSSGFWPWSCLHCHPTH